MNTLLCVGCDEVGRSFRIPMPQPVQLAKMSPELSPSQVEGLRRSILYLSKHRITKATNRPSTRQGCSTGSGLR